MDSFIHVFWTGNSFPYTLRVFIKNWLVHLCNSDSEFQIIVWFTDEAFGAFNQYMQSGVFGTSLDSHGFRPHFRGASVDFLRAKLNFQSFYVARFEPLLDRYQPAIKDAFYMLRANLRMTSAANIARLMILDQCCGIYTDIDYLKPDLSQPFPKNILKFMKLFNMVNRMGFYMCISDLGHKFLVENQCMLLDPASKGKLRELFEDIDKSLRTDTDHWFKKEVESESMYQQSPVTQSLNRSMFNSGLEQELLEAYKQKNFTAYCNVCKCLYMGLFRAGDFYLVNRKKVVHDPEAMMHGERHSDYSITGFLTYNKAVSFFQKYLLVKKEVYCNGIWAAFMESFDKQGAKGQFEFKSAEGKTKGMYNWANPGYARLTKLQGAVNTVERKYLDSDKTFPIELLKAFLDDFPGVLPGNLESKASADDRSFRLDQLKAMVKSIGKRYMADVEIVKIIKTLLRVALIREGWGRETNMGKYALELLRNPVYKRIKDLIDPEKHELEYKDLVDYAEI